MKHSVAHALIGTIVRDVSSEVWPDAWVPHYAIGRTGFLDLHNGQWMPYDSAFPGPEFFERPEFRVVGGPALPPAMATCGHLDSDGCGCDR